MAVKEPNQQQITVGQPNTARKIQLFAGGYRFASV
jgi:hypothetical protein